MILSEINALATSVFSIFQYLYHYIAYYVMNILDIAYVPFAGFVNALCSFQSAILDLFFLSLSWTGETFMYFLGILILFYVLFFAVKILLLLKEIILRWL